MQKIGIVTAITALALADNECALAQESQQPNVVIIFLDDAGYGDYPPFGKPAYPTPNVLQLAEDGRAFTNFYVPQAVCSASRAALLTGCYPGRTKVFGAHPPKARGLSPTFKTMGEIFQKAGYNTAVFGKWHLGDQEETHPYNRGFDESCGLMYSNDMWKHHPGNPEYWGQFPLQYWENDSVTIESVSHEEQKMLTTWYTERSVDFIERYKNKPFFLYVPHSMPHVPLYVSEKFEGKSGKGIYADVMMEIDWSVGKIMAALKEHGLEKNTIVMFTSDNGPWAVYGDHAGVTPFREAKATGFDGGIRSSLIIKYPGFIDSGTTSGVVFNSVDILPSLANIINLPLPEYEIDGKDVWDLITGTTSKNPHLYYPFSTGKTFEGIVTADGRWKLHLPHEYRQVVEYGSKGYPGKHVKKEIPLSLFQMEVDSLETVNVIDQYPEIADSLRKIAKKHEQLFYEKRFVEKE